MFSLRLLRAQPRGGGESSSLPIASLPFSASSSASPRLRVKSTASQFPASALLALCSHIVRSLCPVRTNSSTAGDVLRLAPTNTLASRLAPNDANWLVFPIILSTPVYGVNSRRLFNCVRSSGKLRYRTVLPSLDQFGVPMPPAASFNWWFCVPSAFTIHSPSLPCR